jgi:hypothetical protein
MASQFDSDVITLSIDAGSAMPLTRRARRVDLSP